MKFKATATLYTDLQYEFEAESQEQANQLAQEAADNGLYAEVPQSGEFKIHDVYCTSQVPDPDNIWILGPDDLPQCPRCGDRCESVDLDGIHFPQEQTCINQTCGFKFITEIHEEKEYDNS